jgi:hypothetical protein
MLAAIAATWASVWVRAFFAYGISRSIDLVGRPRPLIYVGISRAGARARAETGEVLALLRAGRPAPGRAPPRAIDYSYRLNLFKAPGAIQTVCGSRRALRRWQHDRLLATLTRFRAMVQLCDINLHSIDTLAERARSYNVGQVHN